MKKALLSSVLALTLVSSFGLWAVQIASAHGGDKGELRIKEKLNDLRKELRFDLKGATGLGNILIDRASISLGEKTFKAEAVSQTGSTLSVRVKGVNMTVNTNANTIIVNRIWDKIALSSIQAGDDLRIAGQISGTTIEAKLIRDLSLPPVLEKNLTGSVTSVTGNTFKLTVGTKEFTVNVDANDTVANRIWEKISLTDIKVGDKVMVFGAVTNLSVEAKLVRDLSLPALQVQALNNLELEIDDD